MELNSIKIRIKKALEVFYNTSYGSEALRYIINQYKEDADVNDNDFSAMLSEAIKEFTTENANNTNNKLMQDLGLIEYNNIEDIRIPQKKNIKIKATISNKNRIEFDTPPEPEIKIKSNLPDEIIKMIKGDIFENFDNKYECNYLVDAYLKSKNYMYFENTNMFFFTNDKEDKWYKFDKNDKLVYYKVFKKFEDSNKNYILTSDVNDDGEKIHIQHSFGYEEDKIYDKNEKLIYYKCTNGEENWYKYDDNGNEIYHKINDEFEIRREYDKNNNCIYIKDKENEEKFFKYDQNNKLISEEKIQYDQTGNKIYHRKLVITDGQKRMYIDLLK